MKIRTIVLGCLTGIIILSTAYEYGMAQTKTGQLSLKVGVVSVREVFRDCKRNIKYRTDAIAEQSKLKAEMDDLSKEIQTEEADLKTLRPGSSEHLAQVKALLDKRAKLDAQQEYVKQQRGFRDKQWTEDVYKEVLTIVKELAKQKGLDMVLDRTDPEFPISGEELMMILNTHKVLYSGGCLDLTKEVVAKLDEK